MSIETLKFRMRSVDFDKSSRVEDLHRSGLPVCKNYATGLICNIVGISNTYMPGCGGVSLGIGKIWQGMPKNVKRIKVFSHITLAGSDAPDETAEKHLYYEGEM